MRSERIEISVIPQDLRHEETIVQIAEVLDDLNFAVNHIFDSLHQRIVENTTRLSSIQDRAAKVQRKLDHLQTNLNLKAVKLYSAAKYPANHTYKEYQLAIQPKFRKEVKPYEIYKSPVPISDKLETPFTASSKLENGQYACSVNMQEKLQFYYVKSKPTKKTKIYEVERDQIRPNVSSVNALLPFYKSDSQGLTNTQPVQNNQKNQIEDAPDSILQPWHSSEMESPSSYLYAPTLGEVPQINVPMSLPDLPGIVDDERFMLDLNFQSPITPSSAVATPTTRKDPPTLERREEQNSSRKLQTIEVTAPKAVMTIESLPPPILPTSSIPAQPKVESALIPTQTIPTVPSSQSIAPSPPPPPPPPPPTSPPEPEELKEEKIQALRKPVSAKPVIVDDRSNLMAAIRNAGGVGKAKLRPAAPVGKSKDRWSSASVGNDLMADLHATLSLRRKGIAGSASNVLAKLSSMIPPPPKPSESSDRNSATSESQDDDGWEE